MRSSAMRAGPHQALNMDTQEEPTQEESRITALARPNFQNGGGTDGQPQVDRARRTGPLVIPVRQAATSAGEVTAFGVSKATELIFLEAGKSYAVRVEFLPWSIHPTGVGSRSWNS